MDGVRLRPSQWRLLERLAAIDERIDHNPGTGPIHVGLFNEGAFIVQPGVADNAIDEADFLAVETAGLLNVLSHTSSLVRFRISQKGIDELGAWRERGPARSAGAREKANVARVDVGDELPRVYGDPAKFKASLRRLVASGQDLLGRLEGVKRMITARGEGGRLAAELHEEQWTIEVERWHGRVWRSLQRHLADGAPALLPTTTVDWPPATGKPRHARRISWVEPWLAGSLSELSQLAAKLGGSRATSAPGSSVSPGTPFGNKRRFAALVAAAKPSLWWFDCHLGRTALELIYDEADFGVLTDIRVLTCGRSKANAAARDDYTRLKGELAGRGVQLEWRTLLDPKDFSEKHDRWIRSGETWYNVPPYSAVLTGKFSSLLREPNPPPFEKWWELGTEITAIPHR